MTPIGRFSVTFVASLSLLLAAGARAAEPASAGGPVQVDRQASAPDEQAPAAAALDLHAAPLALPAQLPVLGSGDGAPGHEGHGDHMSSMWLVMGGMMAVMVVVGGVYMMRGGGRAAPASSAGGAAGPAALALPVAVSPGG